MKVIDDEEDILEKKNKENQKFLDDMVEQFIKDMNNDYKKDDDNE